MNSIEIKTISPPTDPDLLKVADEVTKLVKLSLEKATAHAADAKSYPLPKATDSEEFLENIFYQRFKQLPAEKQKTAKNKVVQLLKVTPYRKRLYGALAAVDLGKNIAVETQAARLSNLPASTIPELSLLSYIRSIQASETPGLRAISGGERDVLTLELVGIECKDETGPEATVWNLGDPDRENTGDHMRMSGNVINEAGGTLPLNPIELGHGFGDNQHRAVRIPIYQFDLLQNPMSYPRRYFANLGIGEIDNGGFSEFFEKLYRKLQEAVIKKLDELIHAGIIKGTAAVGFWLLGPAGEELGKAVGNLIADAIAPVVAQVITAIFDWIESVWNDDMYLPQTLEISIPHRGALFVPNDGPASGLSKEIVINFKRHDGEYNLFFSWNVDWSFSKTNLVTVYGGAFNSNTQSKCFEPGRYDTPQLGIENDSMISITVPEPMTAILFDDWKFMGNRIFFQPGQFGLIPPSFFNKVSSMIIVDNLDDLAGYGVTFFEHSNFQGKRTTFYKGAYNLSPQDRIGPMMISSIKMKRFRLMVQIFEKPNFEGKSAYIDKDTPYVGDEWNDKIASFKIVQHPVIQTVPDIEVPLANKIQIFDQPNFEGNSAYIGEETPYIGDEWKDKIASLRSVTNPVFQTRPEMDISSTNFAKIFERYNLVQMANLPPVLRDIILSAR